MKLPKKGEHYRHFKSTGGMDKVYEIIGLAQEPNPITPGPDTILVIYKPLYENDLLLESKLDFFMRPLSDFTDEVDRDGKIQPRFAFLPPSL